MLDLLERICERISCVLTPSRIVQCTACFRAVAPDALPVIGALRGVGGSYLASGHSVWGMLNGPATVRRWQSSSSTVKCQIVDQGGLFTAAATDIGFCWMRTGTHPSASQ